MDITLILPIIALVIGFLIAWAIKPAPAGQQTAVLEERILLMGKNLQQYEIQISQLQEECTITHKENAANSAIAAERLQDNHQLRHQWQEAIAEKQQLQQELATRQAQLRGAEEQLRQLNERIVELNRTQLLEFEKAANKILEEKTKVFSLSQDEQLKRVLDPFAQNMEDFKKRVEEAYKEESRERFALERELQKLVGMNEKLSAEANNLTNALKGDSKMQGNWGEMILEGILEMSGLTEGREYHKQHTVQNEEGSDLRPDIIVTYPDGRRIVIDSKVSLTAYERYVSSASKEDQDKALADHTNSLKSHVSALGKKEYAKHADALDYVLMFVPIEPAWLLAMKSDPLLWNLAYKQKILLVSPTNLLAVLKIIADLWKIEKQNRNAIDIAEKAGALYDKFTDVMKDFMDVGKFLNSAKLSYVEGLKRLSEGNGNVLKRVEELKEMGAKAKSNKRLPSPEEVEQSINTASQ